jgi:hypothetical protein
VGTICSKIIGRTVISLSLHGDFKQSITLSEKLSLGSYPRRLTSIDMLWLHESAAVEKLSALMIWFITSSPLFSFSFYSDWFSSGARNDFSILLRLY